MTNIQPEHGSVVFHKTRPGVWSGGGGLIQLRCRHSDRVRSHMDPSSWQLRRPFFGLRGTKAGSASERASRIRFSLKPHEHKLAENKETAEERANAFL